MRAKMNAINNKFVGKNTRREMNSESPPRATCMTNSIENATPPQFTKSKNSNFSVQIQIKPQSQFEFVPRDNEESELSDWADLGDAFSVETVIHSIKRV